MGLQIVDDQVLYVVDLATMPELPVTGVGVEQRYAEALTEAIATGVISTPGLYGLAVDHTNLTWQAFAIVDATT